MANDIINKHFDRSNCSDNCHFYSFWHNYVVQPSIIYGIPKCVGRPLSAHQAFKMKAKKKTLSYTPRHWMACHIRKSICRNSDAWTPTHPLTCNHSFTYGKIGFQSIRMEENRVAQVIHARLKNHHWFWMLWLPCFILLHLLQLLRLLILPLMLFDS